MKNQGIYFIGQVAVLMVLSACSIKAPDDATTALGNETAIEEVNAALGNAQGQVPQEQAYHVGDEGVIKTTDYIFTSSGVKKTEILSVTAMDDTGITVKDHIVETNEDLFGKIKRVKAIPAPTPSSSTQASSLFEGNVFGRFVSMVWKTMSRFTSRIKFEASSAVADSEILSAELNSRSSVQASSTKYTNRFFGLQTSSHVVITKNCNHLKECKAHATHIEFNQITTGDDGKSTQVHWTYEISNDVPGLFTVMSKCGSTVITQNDAQIPYKECEDLDTFHFGG